MQAPQHPEETLRLAALHGYRILDTPEEDVFDEIARLASALCGTPLAAISFVDRDRQWFKAEVGLGVRETARDVSFCAHAILGHDEVLEVPDARLDARLCDNPFVCGPPGLRFYAAAQLRSLDGRPIGTLCVMDRDPRRLDDVQRLALRTLARQVMAQLELRRLLDAQRASGERAREAERTQRFLLALEDTLRALAEPDAVLRTVARHLGEHLAASRCAYSTLDPDGAHFTITADHVRDTFRRRGRFALSSFGPAPLAALCAGRPWTVDDVERIGATDAVLAAYRAADVAAVVCVPVLKGGRPIAALSVVQRVPRRWRREEVALVGDVAERCWETLERLQAEQRASRDRRHVELALDAGRMGLWEVDPATGEHRWGDGMYAIFGVDPSVRPVSAARFAALLADDGEREHVRAGIEQLRTDGGEMEIEYRIRRADDGEVRWILTRGALLREEEGVELLVGVSVDNTSRKLAEHRLLEADARKDEFLAMLAHELRNPLAPLANALHLLGRSGALGARDRDMLAMADRQLRQLRRLVDDLLEVGRITRGKIALRCETMRVDTAVNAAVESAAESIERRRQRIAMTLPREPVRIVADPVRVAQVLENLLNNASKYTPEGGSIRVAVRDDRDEVEIRVSDDGIGIERDKIPYLFELFSQIDATIDRSQGGLGIGLAMVRRLVELHGGSVSADSPGLGRGATFAVRFPHRGPAAVPEPHDPLATDPVR